VTVVAKFMMTCGGIIEDCCGRIFGLWPISHCFLSSYAYLVPVVAVFLVIIVAVFFLATVLSDCCGRKLVLYLLGSCS
jgi:hypothetical protein